MVERFFFSSSESEREGSDSAMSFAALAPVLGCAAPGVSRAAPALVEEYERLNELEAIKKLIDILQSVLVRVADNIAQLRRAVRGWLLRVEQIVVRPKRNGCIVRDCMEVFLCGTHRGWLVRDSDEAHQRHFRACSWSRKFESKSAPGLHALGHETPAIRGRSASLELLVRAVCDRLLAGGGWPCSVEVGGPWEP